MRIGFLSNTYTPDTNGVAISLERLVKRLEADGHEVFVAAPKRDNGTYSETFYGLPALPLPNFSRSDIRMPYNYYNGALHFFKSAKIELIHSHDTTFGGTAGTKIAKELAIPSVHTFHTHIETYDYLPVPGYVTLARAFIRKVCNRYDAIITPGTKIEAYLREIGVTAPLYPFLNIPDTIKPTARPVKKPANEYNIDDDTVVITTFGRVAKEKNLIGAIDALEPLLKNRPEVIFLIAGGGPQLSSLKRYVASKKLQQQVRFTGKYDPKKLSTILNISDIYLFTSYSDVQPLTIYEAMLHGLPAVTVDDPAVDYILKPHHNGLKVPIEAIADACSTLINDATLRHAYGKHALESALELSRRPIAEQYEGLYKKLIQDA